MDKDIFAKNFFYISPDTMIHVMKNISFKPLQAHTGPCRPVQAFQKHENSIYFFYNNINLSAGVNVENVFSQHIVVPFCYKMLSSGF